MEAAFLLLIIGCSDDLKRCTELPAPTPIYMSGEHCEGDVPEVMRRFTSNFPQILAKCVPVDPALEEQDAELVWYIDPRGDLIASVEPLGNSRRADARLNGDEYR